MRSASLTNLLNQKKQSKKLLCKDLSMQPKKPLVAIMLESELKPAMEAQLTALLQGLHAIDTNVVIIADKNSPDFTLPNTRTLPYNRQNRKVLLESADIAVSFSFNDVEEMLLNGVVPVTPPRKEVKDYDPQSEIGNGFVYRKEDSWYIFAALVRAIETFKFPYDWKHIVREGISSIGKK